jgi:CheY-like chemotaxis protein
MARVLVADDARVMRMLLRTWLERLEHEVVEAKDGTEVLTLLRDAAASGVPFDIAFCDVHMPGFTGLQILDALRGDGGLAKTPIVLVTTLGHQQDIERGLARGAAAYLTKPVDYVDVYAVLRRLTAA